MMRATIPPATDASLMVTPGEKYPTIAPVTTNPIISTSVWIGSLLNVGTTMKYDAPAITRPTTTPTATHFQ